jgi:hypothetical protein
MDQSDQTGGQEGWTVLTKAVRLSVAKTVKASQWTFTGTDCVSHLPSYRLDAVPPDSPHSCFRCHPTVKLSVTSSMAGRIA